MIRRLGKELLAYAQLGLTVDPGFEPSPTCGGHLDVMLVHGVAGRVAQFHRIRDALEDAGADHFEDPSPTGSTPSPAEGPPPWRWGTAWAGSCFGWRSNGDRSSPTGSEA